MLERIGSTADFILSFVAIVPLASLLGDATEQCALKLGQTTGGLLNAVSPRSLTPFSTKSSNHHLSQSPLLRPSAVSLPRHEN